MEVYRDENRGISERVGGLLSRMTLPGRSCFLQI
jgi:hypothetical protein